MDWFWAENPNETRLPSGKKTDYSSSSWSITTRRRWCDWILEIKIFSTERFWAISALVWWNLEEQSGKRRRQQEMILILYWLVRTRNSLSPSSSRSYWIQSHWSFTPGQCVNSGQFLRVHLSYWMCNQFTLHKFRINTGRTNFKQGKTDSILNGCESNGQGAQRSARAWLDHITSCMVQAEKTWKKHQDTVYWSDIQLAQREGFIFHQTRCNAIIFYDTLPAYCIPKVVVMESGENLYEKVYASPRLGPTISFKDNWMKEMAAEVAGSSKDTQRKQPKPKTPITKNGETRGWTKIHPELRVNACWNCGQRRIRRRKQ